MGSQVVRNGRGKREKEAILDYKITRGKKAPSTRAFENNEARKRASQRKGKKVPPVEPTRKVKPEEEKRGEN